VILVDEILFIVFAMFCGLVQCQNKGNLGEADSSKSQWKIKLMMIDVDDVILTTQSRRICGEICVSLRAPAKNYFPTFSKIQSYRAEQSRKRIILSLPDTELENRRSSFLVQILTIFQKLVVTVY
jgi:hypothetical protein